VTKPVLIAGNANPELAQEIADHLGIALCDAQIRRFGDGEVSVHIRETVRGCDVYIIQPTCTPVNDHLMELMLITDALRRASAKQVTAVIPYFGYARQDRKHIGRVPISAKLVANLIRASGASRVLTLDLHAGQIQGFFDIPVDNLRADPIFAERFSAWQSDRNVVVTAPDIGGMKRARLLAEGLDLSLAIVEKRRQWEQEETEVMSVIGDVKGKKVLIVDDIISTGGTIINATNALIENGADEVWAACTHAVFSDSALETLKNSALEHVVVTNSIPSLENEGPFVERISIGELFAETIQRVSLGESVSALFPHD
jgi:ribose-phosphate pyrophosphokinase